ncbi:recombination directionality factor [Kitasatospora cineracea]|uniref:recombination directionality factor n=1 Tax=Kitasatospora cineracea TaxID=88074 RepID=UPI003795F81A
MSNALDNIFASDPELAERAERAEANARPDLAGVFRNYEAAPDGGFPIAQHQWMVTCALPVTAEAVAELLGGTPYERETEAEDAMAVKTDADRVEVVIDGPEAVKLDFKQWVNGKLAHHCDTRTFLSPPEDVGVPCRCPGTIAELKDRAKAERGPKPSIEIDFALPHALELGTFRYKSSGWSLIPELPALKGALAKSAGPSLAHLVNERVQYTSKAGREVDYQKATVKVVKPYGDAIADTPATAIEEEPPF